MQTTSTDRRFTRYFKQLTRSLLILSIGLFGFTQTAFANTAADATILNVVTVNYSDASGTQSFTATASATVTVNLVAATPTLMGRPSSAAPGDTAARPAEQTVMSGDTAIYLYSVTSNANGDDTYSLAGSGIDAVSNVANESVNFFEADPTGAATSAANPASIILGASVVIGVTSSDTLQFPGGTLDEVEAGDIVVVNGVDYTVTAVTNGTGATHSNLGGVEHTTAGNTVDEVFGSVTVAANADGSNTTPDFQNDGTASGDLLREQKLLRFEVTAVTTTPGVDGTVDFDVVVQDAAAAAAAVTEQDVTTTFQAVNLSIQKDVRNVTAGGAFGADAFGDPGDVLEYRLTVRNTGGDATNVIVTDPIPSFTTLVTSGTDFATVTDGTNTVTITTANTDTEDANLASGDAAGTAAGDLLSFFIGQGNDGTAGSGGTVVNGDTITITYQVTID